MWLSVTRKDGPTKLKFFTYEQLVKATRIAIERDYNRQFDLDQIEDLPRDGRFPITFEMPHEHRAGEPVPMHMRCAVTLDSSGGGGFLDTDLELWNSLGTVEVPNPKAIGTPSRN